MPGGHKLIAGGGREHGRRSTMTSARSCSRARSAAASRSRSAARSMSRSAATSCSITARARSASEGPTDGARPRRAGVKTPNAPTQRMAQRPRMRGHLVGRTLPNAGALAVEPNCRLAPQWSRNIACRSCAASKISGSCQTSRRRALRSTPRSLAASTMLPKRLLKARTAASSLRCASARGRCENIDITISHLRTAWPSIWARAASAPPNPAHCKDRRWFRSSAGDPEPHGTQPFRKRRLQPARRSNCPTMWLEPQRLSLLSNIVLSFEMRRSARCLRLII